MYVQNKTLKSLTTGNHRYAGPGTSEGSATLSVVFGAMGGVERQKFVMGSSERLCGRMGVCYRWTGVLDRPVVLTRKLT